MDPQFQEGTQNERHVKKCINSMDNATFDEVVKVAELFQKQTMKFIPNQNHDYVINTDQTGCE
jgi:hypothetical protein